MRNPIAAIREAIVKETMDVTESESANDRRLRESWEAEFPNGEPIDQLDEQDRLTVFMAELEEYAGMDIETECDRKLQKAARKLNKALDKWVQDDRGDLGEFRN